MIAGQFIFPGEQGPRKCRAKLAVLRKVKAQDEEIQDWVEIVKKANRDSRTVLIIQGSAGPVGILAGVLAKKAMDWVTVG